MSYPSLAGTALSSVVVVVSVVMAGVPPQLRLPEAGRLQLWPMWSSYLLLQVIWRHGH